MYVILSTYCRPITIQTLGDTRMSMFIFSSIHFWFTFLSVLFVILETLVFIQQIMKIHWRLFGSGGKQLFALHFRRNILLYSEVQNKLELVKLEPGRVVAKLWQWYRKRWRCSELRWWYLGNEELRVFEIY